MLDTSKNVQFPSYNHLLTTGTDDLSLAGAQAVIRVRVVSTDDLYIGHF